MTPNTNLSALAARLKEYAAEFQYFPEIPGDLIMAAKFIESVLQSQDDFK